MNITFLTKTEARDYLYYSDTFKEYYNNTDTRTLKTKTGKANRSINNYLDKLQNFTENEINTITNVIRKLPKNPLNIADWKFIKFSNSIEKSWPFTIDNAIVVTSDFINYSDNKDLRYTLCHERIHILQFLFPKFFNDFIRDDMGFKMIKLKNHLIDDTRFINYSNPDGLQTKNKSWIYKVGNKNFIPLLLLESGEVVKKGLRIKIKNGVGEIVNPRDDFNNTIAYFSQKYPYLSGSHLYHPDEILADYGSKFILGYRVILDNKDSNLYHFFERLKDFYFRYYI